MVSISELSLIIIIQSIVMLIILAAFLFFLLRVKNKELKAMMLASSSSEEEEKEEVDSPLASVEYYLTAEIKLLESRFDMLFKDDDLLSSVFGEHDWIALRKGFLEIEKDFVINPEKMNSLWVETGKKIKKLLDDSNLVKRIKLKEVNDDDEDDAKEMKLLLKSQYDDFDNLHMELEGEKSEEEIQVIKDKLNNIIRNHTELSHCIHMLESENVFLRDQIKELVH